MPANIEWQCFCVRVCVLIKSIILLYFLLIEKQRLSDCTDPNLDWSQVNDSSNYCHPWHIRGSNTNRHQPTFMTHSKQWIMVCISKFLGFWISGFFLVKFSVIDTLHELRKREQFKRFLSIEFQSFCGKFDLCCHWPIGLCVEAYRGLFSSCRHFSSKRIRIVYRTIVISKVTNCTLCPPFAVHQPTWINLYLSKRKKWLSFKTSFDMFMINFNVHNISQIEMKLGERR